MQNPSFDSRLCRDIRFPLIMMVIFIHSFGKPSVVRMDEIACIGVTYTDMFNIVRVLGSNLLSHVSVPIFFLMSGYWFFYGVSSFGKNEYMKKLSKRVRTLFVPYLVWIAIYVCFMLTMKMGGVILHDKPISGIIDWLNEHQWLHMFWDSEEWGDDRHNVFGIPSTFSGPVLLPMWFVRYLIEMVIISPVIYLLAVKLKRWFAILLFVCWLTELSLPIKGAGTLLSATTFFGFGAYLSLNKLSISATIGKRIIKYGSLIVFLLLLEPMVLLNGQRDS